MGKIGGALLNPGTPLTGLVWLNSAHYPRSGIEGLETPLWWVAWQRILPLGLGLLSPGGPALLEAETRRHRSDQPWIRGLELL